MRSTCRTRTNDGPIDYDSKDCGPRVHYVTVTQGEVGEGVWKEKNRTIRQRKEASGGLQKKWNGESEKHGATTSEWVRT